MAQYVCRRCSCATEHMNIAQAARYVQKDRKTIKIWIQNEWVPFQELPSGRVYLCKECLLKPHGPASPESDHRKLR